MAELFQPNVCILCDLPTKIDGVPIGMVITLETGTSAHFDCIDEFNDATPALHSGDDR